MCICKQEHITHRNRFCLYLSQMDVLRPNVTFGENMAYSDNIAYSTVCRRRDIEEMLRMMVSVMRNELVGCPVRFGKTPLCHMFEGLDERFMLVGTVVGVHAQSDRKKGGKVDIEISYRNSRGEQMTDMHGLVLKKMLEDYKEHIRHLNHYGVPPPKRRKTTAKEPCTRINASSDLELYRDNRWIKFNEYSSLRVREVQDCRMEEVFNWLNSRDRFIKKANPQPVFQTAPSIIRPQNDGQYDNSNRRSTEHSTGSQHVFQGFPQANQEGILQGIIQDFPGDLPQGLLQDIIRDLPQCIAQSRSEYMERSQQQQHHNITIPSQHVPDTSNNINQTDSNVTSHEGTNSTGQAYTNEMFGKLMKNYDNEMFKNQTAFRASPQNPYQNHVLFANPFASQNGQSYSGFSSSHLIPLLDAPNEDGVSVSITSPPVEEGSSDDVSKNTSSPKSTTGVGDFTSIPVPENNFGAGDCPNTNNKHGIETDIYRLTDMIQSLRRNMGAADLKSLLDEILSNKSIC